jgi:hypothetical protein
MMHLRCSDDSGPFLRIVGVGVTEFKSGPLFKIVVVDVTVFQPGPASRRENSTNNTNNTNNTTKCPVRSARACLCWGLDVRVRSRRWTRERLCYAGSMRPPRRGGDEMAASFF